MDDLLIHGLLHFLGWIYLWLRFRNKKRVKEALICKYQGKYSQAGASLLEDTIWLIGVIIAIAFFLVMLVALIRIIINYLSS